MEATVMERKRTMIPRKLGKILKEVIRWYLDLINPKRIIKYFINDAKNNKLVYAIAAVAIVIIGAVKVGSMDFDSGQLFGGSLFAMVCGGDANKTLKIDPGLLSMGEALYNLVQPLGLALVVLYWVLELVGLSVRDSFTPEIIAMHMIKLVVGVFLMDKGWDIVKALNDLSEGLSTYISNSFLVAGWDSGTVTESNVVNGIIKIIDMLRIGVPLLLMFLMGLISRIVLMLMCITRSIKMVLYLGFAPIALSDLAGNEHSTSMRYMKQILALALQGAIILGINLLAGSWMLNGASWGLDSIINAPSVGDSIWNTVKASTFSFWGIVPVFAIGCAAIGMYSKSEDIARTIVGV